MTGTTAVSTIRVKNLFEAATVDEVMERMAQLTPESERQWGKMNPAQMMAHCSATMGMAMGTISPPRILLGRLLGQSRIRQKRCKSEGINYKLLAGRKVKTEIQI